MQRVFISYSRRNKAFAERLARDLSDAGLEVWVDFRQIHAGEKWREEIMRGIERSEIVIVALSPQATDSEWVQLEANTARKQGKFILPVMAKDASAQLVENHPLHWLTDLQYIAFEDRYEQAFPELLRALPGKRRVGPYNPVAVENIPNPFKGLEAFQQTDTAFFFGRETLIKKSLHRLRQGRDARFLAVVGASGSGKSSLVRAGVIPALRRGELPNSENWRITIFTPGESPVEALARRLAPLVPDRDMTEVNKLLNQSPEYLVPLATQALDTADLQTYLLLVVDQFEEVFTRAGESERRQFLEILNVATTKANCPTKVLITMRADFFDHLSRYPELAELFEQENMIIVTEMSPAELFRAIEGPAQAVGLRYDDGLPQRILQDVQSQPGSLPLLQYALKELYARREGNRLTMAAYEAIGGVQQALAQHAEKIYQRLGPAQQAIMRRVLLRLVEVNANGEATRRKVNRDELNFRDVPYEAVQEVIDLMTAADSRLLITSREIKSSNDQTPPVTWVEVGHEALIREWDRFKGWVGENVENLRYGSELMQTARDWRQRDYDPSYLLTGNRLDRAEDWLQQADPTVLQREFIQASIEENEKREAQRQKQIERELNLQRRASARLRLVAVVLVVGLIITGILTVITLEQLNRANDAQARAEANAQRARSLALSSNANRALSDDDTQLAVLLAVEASLIDNPPPQSPRTLAEVAYTPGTLAVFTEHNGDVENVVVNGDRVLSSSSNRLILWDLNTRAVIPTEFDEGGHTAAITDLAFRPNTNGTQAITSGEDGLLILWDVTTGNVIRRFSGFEGAQHDRGVTTVAFTPDGETVASGGAGGEILIWEVDTGAPRSAYIGDALTPIVLRQNDTAVADLTYNVDQLDLVALYDDGTLHLWQPENNQLLNMVIAPVDRDFPLRIASHPVDASEVAVGYEGRIELWNIYTGLRVGDGNIDGGILNLPISADVTDLHYSADGSKLVVAADGEPTIFELDAKTGQLLTRLSTHNDTINSVAYGPNARLIVSASDDDTLQVLDTRSGKQIAIYPYTTDDNASVVADYGADDNLILTGFAGGDKTLTLWDVSTGAALQQFTGHSDAVTDVELSADGTVGVSSSADGSVIVWNIETGTDRLRFTGHTDGTQIEAVALVPGTTQVVSANDSGQVLVWDTADGRVVYAFEPAVTKNDVGHIGGVNTVAVSRDGTRALTAGEDNLLLLWDLTTGTLIREIGSSGAIMHTDEVLSVAFDVAGQRAVSGGADKRVILWNIETGDAIRQFDEHDQNVFAVDFAPDGDSVVSASFDRTIRLWDLESGFELRRISTDDSAPQTIEFGQQGLKVLTGMDDSTAREWRILTDITDLIAWTFANRYVPVPSCEDRRDFELEPLCADDVSNPPTPTPFPLPTTTPLPVAAAR